MKTIATAAIRCTLHAAILAVALPFLPAPSHAQTVPVDYTRPFIWVRNSDRAGIVEKINTQFWAQSVYNALVARVASPVASHQANRDAYLRQLPINWTATPPIITTGAVMRGQVAPRFTEALDCAVLYYITQDGKYARLAADLLHNAVKTIAPLPTDGIPGTGYLIPGDIGTESRCVGTQLPIIYDLLHPYLQTNQVYDVETASMVNFNFADAQTVFRAAYEDGWLDGNGNNHNGFHSHMTFNNMLALDDAAERETAIQAFITSTHAKACSIAYVNKTIAKADDIWPECFNYTGVMNNGYTSHMILLDRINPNLRLFETYPSIPASIHRKNQFLYPNGELIQHGHTKRVDNASLAYNIIELAYAHALARGYTEQAKFWGGVIKHGMQTGDYERWVTQNDISGGALSSRRENLQLLLQAPSVAVPAAPLPEPRTDDLVYAGITLQRNPSSNNNTNFGLMCFVGGAGYTHGHASGMNIELYGAGLVMGRKGHAEEGDRGSDLHNNFDRIFGGANTVIVNGASMGYGGHAWLAINKVENVAMEPRPFAPAVSSNHSFTVSSFLDDKGDMAEGTQQRMLSIVRTSPTTGYYVDIFRSKSAVTNRAATTLDGVVTNQYHDYIYRNIGETNITVQTDGGALPLYPQPERFADTSAYTDRYKFPGFVHFTNTVVSYRTNVAFRTRFAATVSSVTRYMDMHMPSVANREIAKVDSPPFSDAPSPYHNRNAPTLVVRQIGDAWDKPFAAVYEPHFGSNGGTVQNVTAIEQGGLVVGLKVVSLVNGTNVTQYVLSHPDANGVISVLSAGIQFSGRFAAITDRADGTGELYLGQGTSLAYGGRMIRSSAGNATQASLLINSSGLMEVTANDSVIVSDAENGLIIAGDAYSSTPYSDTLTDTMFPPLSPGGGTSRTFAKVSGPSWLVVASNGALSGTPGNGNLGLNEFTVSVSDGISPPAISTLRITVLPDTTPPTAVSFTPADGLIGASVDNDLRLTFSENVVFGTGAITLHRTSDDALVESFDVAIPSAGLSLSGPTVTINPTADLAYLTGYYVKIDPTALRDLAGNAFAGIANKTTWNFTTAIESIIRTWTGGSSVNGAWNRGDNWNAPPTFNESLHAVFHAPGAARLNTHLQDNYTIGWLTFNTNADANVTIRLFRSDGVRNLTVGGATNRNPAITVEAGATGNHTIGTDGTAGTYGNLILAGDLTVEHNGGGTLTMNRPITQSGGTRSLTKTGSGTLVLSSTNTYAGATAIYAGRLHLGAGGSIAASASVSIDAGATLDTTAKASYAIPAGRTYYFGIDAEGDASIGTIQAAGLDISNAAVTFYSYGTPADAVYVLATYTSLTGDMFASVSGLPADYVIDYAYEGNKIALVPVPGVIESPYEIWSAGAAFEGDANGDGVPNGIAFLLGASIPSVNATALLPIATANGEGLVLTFTMLNASNRGGLVLNLQHRSNLGIGDAWTTVVVPETSGGPFNGVTFTITPGTTLNTVVATISPDEAADGKIFSRLQAVDP